MSLIDEEMTPVAMVEKTSQPDGEGGFVTSWRYGAEFQAAITFDASMQARVAYSQGVSSVYTVTTSKNAKLEYNDVIQRLSDGKVFRITSDGDDIQTPDRASFQFLQVTAKEWSLT